MTLNARTRRLCRLVTPFGIISALLLAVSDSGRVRAGGDSVAAPSSVMPIIEPGVADAAPRSAHGPIIESGITEAIERDGTAIVHVVLRGGRELPPGPTPADESRYRSAVAAAHRAFRSSLAGHGVRILQEHAWAYGLIAEIDAEGLESLGRAPRVERVYPDGVVHTTLAQGVLLIRADVVQQNGWTGAGMTIAILDTGIDYNHSALGGCFGPSCRVVGGYDYVNNDGNPVDDNGHGTMVAGVAAASSGSIKGVAPDAKLAALKVLAANGSGTFAAIDQGLNWVLTNRATWNIKVANISFSDGNQYLSFMAPCSGSNTATLINNLVNAGVAVTVASGNNGYDAGVSFPACVGKATAVGGVYDDSLPNAAWCLNPACSTQCQNSFIVPDKFVCYTNAGGPLDILAPDWKSTTTSPGGGTSDLGGTSAASAYAAGAFALMFSVAPSVSVSAIETGFKQTGWPVQHPQNGVHYPRIDIDLAVQYLDRDLDGFYEDNCPEIYNPTQTDTDSDTFGDVCDNCPSIYNISQASADGDPSGDPCDCDSSHASVYVGAPEICDGLNNDCSHPQWPSLVVETDDDGDGQAECGGDCDDADPLRRFNASEVCDGIDNNCDNEIPINEVDNDGDAYRMCDNDCNDSDPNIHPGAVETCNGIDDDCVGGIPGEVDADADGYQTCRGDCDDSRSWVHPGAPEICDGLDDDCLGGVPSNEADGDTDGFIVCQGDCDDAEASTYPGAPEVCDGRNNDCSSPVWPSLSVESDDDGDGFAECAGDCNDADPRVGWSAEICDEQDNDCDGSIDPGYAYVMESTLLASVTDPNGAALDQLGSAVIALPDVNGDGVPDFAAGSLGTPPGSTTMGSIVLFSSVDRSVIRKLVNPPGVAGSQMGRSAASMGDVNGDGVPDVAGGAPYHDISIGDQGRVVAFSGATGGGLWSYQDFLVPSESNIGFALASIADLNGDGTRDLAVGIPGDCIGGVPCGGSVRILEGDSGALIRPLTDGNEQTDERFGAAVAVVGDLNGDGKEDVAVGAPGKDLGQTDAGEVMVFSGATGGLLFALQDPAPAASDGFGSAIAAVGDLDGDGKKEILVGEPGRDTAAGSNAGSALLFSGANGAFIRRFVDPDGAASDQLGSAVASGIDGDLDLYDDILLGAPYDTTAAGAEAGSVLVFSGRTGNFAAKLTHPSGAAFDHFGGAMVGLPVLDGDGLPEIAVAAAGDDTAAGVDAGTIQILSPILYSDCDGDGIRNTLDTCTDWDHDGYGSSFFQPTTCPAECDDDHASAYPGAPQVCDGYNNDCSDPSWPSVPSGECLVTPNLVVTTVSGQVKLDWGVPAGGANAYRIYRGNRADLLAGHNGGYCLTTVATNSATFTDTIPAGTMSYYIVASVRAGVEGSRGLDSAGLEREHSSICP